MKQNLIIQEFKIFITLVKAQKQKSGTKVAGIYMQSCSTECNLEILFKVRENKLGNEVRYLK